MTATSLNGLGAWSKARSLVSSLDTSRNLSGASPLRLPSDPDATVDDMLIGDDVPVVADHEAGPGLGDALALL